MDGINHVVLGIMAHADAGKTTLTEAILYETGAIRSFGRVDHRDCFLDDDEMERSRGITIFSKQAQFELERLDEKGACGERMHRCTLVDTPGHADFTPEMERAMSVMDAAILVISGTDGVQGHTENIWRLLEKYQIPVFLFLNKMDRETACPETLFAQMRGRLSEQIVDFSSVFSDSVDNPEETKKDLSQVIQLPQKVLEEIAVCDEELMEHYLEEDYSVKEWCGAIAGAFCERKLFPCFMGSALQREGIVSLLKGMRWLLPLQKEQDDAQRTGAQKSERQKGAFSARVYKILHDSQGERLTFFKVTGGMLKVKDVVSYGNPRREEKVNQLRIYHGGRYQTVASVETGMLCAAAGLSQTWPGDGLGADQTRCVYDTEPVLTAAAIPPDGCDEKKLLGLLRLLEEEEPALKVYRDDHLKEIQVHIMGPIQLEILKYQFETRFGLSLDFGPCRILYKETINSPVTGCGHYEPLRHYAEAHLLMEPLPAGSGIETASICSTDVLDLNFQRLILTHVTEKEHRGVLTGAPLTDVRFTLVTGRSHLKHTEGGDFREAVYRAVRHGLMQAREKNAAVLLEPWYAFAVSVPSADIGRAMADVQLRNGSFEPFELNGDMAVLKGEGPAVCFMEYPVELAAYTKGRGSVRFTMIGYRPCHNAQEVIEALGYEPEKDLANPAGSVFCSHGAGYVVPWREAAEKMHCK
ncbi:MAG: TetM/TetW/TetO/TetS family tetracycline resistance ribosomal protection protein [Lachnospiraceae bacterium]|nr:TetM/TetW/TetO/TetS family tetracycline resistance ribosomal protection protein [Lachnospiraceae bacterium]